MSRHPGPAQLTTSFTSPPPTIIIQFQPPNDLLGPLPNPRRADTRAARPRPIRRPQQQQIPDIPPDLRHPIVPRSSHTTTTRPPFTPHTPSPPPAAPFPRRARPGATLAAPRALPSLPSPAQPLKAREESDVHLPQPLFHVRLVRQHRAVCRLRTRGGG
jgi:hypothetical protein